MGQVYVARDERFERLVAVKLLHRHVAESEDGRTRFEREARTLSLVVHPNVVTVHDYGHDAGRLFLVMEFVDGLSLDAVVRNRGRLGVREAATTVCQVAEGLAEIHRAGIVHRDIKPQNIVMRELAGGASLAKVVDFGLARSEEGADLTAVGELLGTPYYMAPEQIQGGTMDGRVDQYALGVVLFELLTGQRPFQRDTVQSTLIAHLMEEPPALAAVGSAGIDASLEEVVQRALAKDPTDRYATILDFADAIRAATGDAPARGELCTCDTCAGRTPAEGRHCGHCGAALVLSSCAACGAPREGVRLHCGRCMASLVPATPHVRANEDGRPAQLPLRPCTLVALVASLPDNAATTGPTLDLALRCQSIVEREGGRVLGVMGRELIAAFGVGGLRPGEVEAAVDAGLEMVALSPTGAPQLRVGVDVGRAATIGTGTAWGASYVVGDVLEAARSAQAQAEVGQLVIGEAAYEDVRTAYVGRGLTDGFRLVERRKAVSFVDYVHRSGEPPHVGRDIEMGQLRRAQRRVGQRGELGVAVISGPPGIGKSRLVGEFLADVEDGGQGWHIDVARCRRSHSAAPYEPFVELLTQRMSVHGGARVEATIRALRDLPGMADPTRTLAADDNRLQRVAELLRSHPDTETLPPGQALDLAQKQAFDGYAAYVVGAAADRPVLLALEDVENASAATLELLTHVMRACADRPILMLLTLDESAVDALLPAVEGAAGRVHHLALEPLERQDCLDVVRWALPPESPPVDVVTAIYGFSEGIPQQVVEAATALRSSAAYTGAETVWACSDPALAVSTLEHSRDELTSRVLARTSATARELGAVIAIAGGTAPRDLVIEMLGRSGIDQDVAELKRRRVLVERRGGGLLGGRELALRTDRLVELLLADMPRDRIHALHRSAAGWLTQRRASVPGIAARVADHRRAAGDHRQAAEALIEAATEAVRRLAGKDALSLYRQAVEAARLAADPSVSTIGQRRTLWDALVGVAETGARHGAPSAAIDAACEADDLLRHFDAKADPEALPAHCRVLSALGDAYAVSGQPDAAIEAFARLEARADGRSALDRFAAHAVSRRALVLHLALNRNEESGAIASNALDRWGRDQRRELASSLGRLTTCMGHLAIHARQLDDADTWYARAARHFQTAGDALGAAMVGLSQGNVAYRRGDLTAAEQRYRETGTHAEAIGHTHGSLMAKTNLGHVLLDAGRIHDAIEVLEVAAATARKTRVVGTLPETLRLLAECRHRIGDVSGALDTAKQALIRAHSMGGQPVVDKVQRTIQRLREGHNDASE